MSDERSANAVDRRLGQRLRARRLELGISQERLAEILGVTFQQVQKYEKGVNRIAASRLFEMATALDVPVSHFFEGIITARPAGVSEEAPDDYVYGILATADGQQLIRLFSMIKSARLRRRIVELVRTLAEEESALDPDAHG